MALVTPLPQTAAPQARADAARRMSHAGVRSVAGYIVRTTAPVVSDAGDRIAAGTELVAIGYRRAMVKCVRRDGNGGCAVVPLADLRVVPDAAPVCACRHVDVGHHLSDDGRRRHDCRVPGCRCLWYRPKKRRSTNA